MRTRQVAAAPVAAFVAVAVPVATFVASFVGSPPAGPAIDDEASPAFQVFAGNDYPQHLGPSRDGRISGEGVAAAWPAAGPPELWRLPVGEGFAGPAVSDGKLVLFHRVDDREIVEAHDAATGERLWSTGYPTSYRDDFGFDEGPRAVPTIAGGRVFTFGAQGVLQALDLATGERLWMIDTHERFAVPKGFFGAASAPLVAGGRVMVNVGGAGAGVVAFDVAKGEVLWTATEHGASYSTGVIAPLGGVTVALFFTREGLVEIDPADGRVRADFRWRSRSAASVNAATPLVIDERVFLSASYNTGAVLLARGDDGFTPVWSSDDVLSNHYATSVRHRGYLYGYHGRQEYSPSLRAVELATGTVAWSVDRFGGGSILLAGDTLLILREGGELVLAEASPAAFAPIARARILTGTVRAYPAVAGGILYARNERELVAVRLGG
jgi:outer membrane protein assembly factor BamB